MKAQSKGFDWKGIALAMLWILFVAAGVRAQDSETPTTPPERLFQWHSQASFGMMGLTINQTARLNVAWVSTGCPLSFQWFDPQLPVRLLFLDRQGAPVARQAVRLIPGQAGWLDLAGNAIPAGQFQGPRASIRALALLPALPFRLLRPCLAALQPVPEPRPPETPGADGTDGQISVQPVVVPYLSLYPPGPIPFSDASFKLTVEIFDSATGETKLILENPSIIPGISPWPLAITGPDGSSGGDSGASPPAP